jgi:hypothetical protein
VRGTKVGCRLVETVSQKMSDTDYSPRMYREGITRAKANTVIGMFDRDFRLSGPESQIAAEIPTKSKARVEDQGTVNQLHSGVNIFPEMTQHVRCSAENRGVVSGESKSLSG